MQAREGAEDWSAGTFIECDTLGHGHLKANA